MPCLRPILLALVLTAAPSDPAGAARGPGLVVELNRALFEVAVAEDGLLTLKGVRCAAMMHLAIHDALNTVEPHYERYLASGPTRDGADPLAAAAEAAYEVVVDQYPEESGRFGALREAWLAAVPDSTGLAHGRRLGQQIAQAVLDQRRGDGWDTDADYEWHPMGPGVYAEFSEHSDTPEGFVFGAGWGRARPFFLERPDQFRSPPPPAIDSDAYTGAFQEVKEVGRSGSDVRTADEAHLAMWWKDFVENSHNRLARDLALREDLELWRAARLFALINASVFDAYVNVFDNKFFYDHWRPYTAIRWAEHDGNPDTEPDLDWDNLHGHTYAFPSYPSAHGCASAAAMTVLADTFGNDTRFAMRTRFVDRAGPFSGLVEMHPPVRRFTSFSAAAMECSMSRVYLGIHFRYDSIEGNRLGRSIGEYGLAEFLREAGP